MNNEVLENVMKEIVYFSPLIGALLVFTAVTLAFHFEKVLFGKLGKNKVVEQIVIGIAFGLSVIYANEIGAINVGGAMINARDAGPLCAGLIFGGPAGLIAGVIGGLERWFSVYWGAGTYTRLACSIACVNAGMLAWGFRKLIFRNKLPGAFQALFIALVSEVVHLLLVFITHPQDVRYAFYIVRLCSWPIIITTITTVFIVVSTINVYTDKKEEQLYGRKRHIPDITLVLQKNIFILMVFAFVISMTFEIYLLHNATLSQSANIITLSVEDAYNTCAKTMDEYQNDTIAEFVENAHIGESGGILFTDANFNVITYINKNGESIGYDFAVDKKDYCAEGKLFRANVEGTLCLCIFKNYKTKKIVGYYPVQEAYYTNYMVAYLSAYMYVIIFAILFVIIYVLINRMVVKNVNTINETMDKISNGELNNAVNVRPYKEFNKLSNGINRMLVALKKYIQEAEKRVADDLELAKKIQHSAVPTVFPKDTGEERYDVYAYMQTAKSVGGDFYDFYHLNNDKFVYLVADVSGKGIPAAMFMMKAKSIIKSFAETGADLATVMSYTNDELCDNNTAEMFVTAFVCVVDLRTGRVEYVDAGHNPPIFIHKDGEVEYLQTKPNMVLAGMEGIKYRKNEFILKPGDAFFMYTDGVTEAINKEKELYGEDRLLKVAKDNKLATMEDLCNNISIDLTNFVDGEDQFDDITMISFRYKGEGAMNEITVDATLANVDTVTDFVNKELEKLNCPMKAQMEIDIAIDEIFSNIANYAYNPEIGKATIRFEVEKDPLSVVVTFMDKGAKYDPLEKADPDIKASIEERTEGGLGIFMVKKSMDNVEYEYKDGKNILKIKKNI